MSDIEYEDGGDSVSRGSCEGCGESNSCGDSGSCGGCGDQSCEGCGDRGMSRMSFIEAVNENSSIKKVVGVVSGKGGVGKSFITAMLAVLMNKRGYKTGIMDADITGPSIAGMFGLDKKAQMNRMGILPEKTPGGISVISMNFFLEQTDDPVIWRGPVLGAAVKQFWTDVYWGDLDVLLIDMPPGTGDVPLTVFQSIPLDGIVIVTSPQELVSNIVKKAFHMARKMNVPILGIVENMSFLKCPDCGKEIPLFGKSRLRETAGELYIDVLGKVPIDPKNAELADSGRFEECEEYLSEAADKIEEELFQSIHRA